MPLPSGATVFLRAINASCASNRLCKRASNSLRSIVAILLAFAQAAADLKAHASIVIGAFPLAQLRHIKRWHALARGLPKPFAVLPVNHVSFNEPPGAQCRRQKMLAAAQLISVDETAAGFALRPPVLFGIRDAARVGFI